MWSSLSHGRDNFQKLILTQTPTLTDMVSVMVTDKLAYKTSVKDMMDKDYEMFRGKNSAKTKDLFNSPDIPEHSDQPGRTRTQMGELD